MKATDTGKFLCPDCWELDSKQERRGTDNKDFGAYHYQSFIKDFLFELFFVCRYKTNKCPAVRLAWRWVANDLLTLTPILSLSNSRLHHYSVFLRASRKTALRQPLYPAVPTTGKPMCIATSGNCRVGRWTRMFPPGCIAVFITPLARGSFTPL